MPTTFRNKGHLHRWDGEMCENALEEEEEEETCPSRRPSPGQRLNYSASLFRTCRFTLFLALLWDRPLPCPVPLSSSWTLGWWRWRRWTPPRRVAPSTPEAWCLQS